MDFYNPTHLAYHVRGAVTRGRRRYDQDEYRSPDNRYYHPPCENNISPLSQRRNTRRRRSYSRSGSRLNLFITSVWNLVFNVKLFTKNTEPMKTQKVMST